MKFPSIRQALGAALLWAAASGFAEQPQKHDLARLLRPLTAAAPKAYPASEQDKGDIKALFFDGLDYEGHPTRVFAYVGLPAGANARRKVPGMVLVHGGGGTAFPEWVRVWNERGYAAIAMDLEGHAPITNPPAAGPARVGVFEDTHLPLTNQWMFHALADIMLGNSLLAAQPGVDARRIGVTGISWGGVLSSLVAGVDERFKFAAPVYGCGFLYDSGGYFGQSLRAVSGTEFARRAAWDPARYFAGTQMPVLWVNGDQDAHFSVDITSRSQLAVKRNSFLCIHPAMPHGHQPGWDPRSVPEIYAFADHILKHGAPLPRVVYQSASGTNFVVKYRSPSLITNVVVWFVREPLSYQATNRMSPAFKWHHLSADINPHTRTVTVAVPADAKAYYVNLTDARGLIASANLTLVGQPAGTQLPRHN